MMERLTKVLRWMARLWSLLSIFSLLVPYVMEGVYWLQATSVREVIGHVCFFAVLIGLILAWRWEGWGGGLTVGSVIAFYVTWWLDGRTPRGPFFLLIAAPGFLFLLCWLLTCKLQKEEQVMDSTKNLDLKEASNV